MHALVDGGATDGQRPAPVATEAERRALGIGVLDLDVVVRDTELIGHQLRQGRFMTLAMRQRPCRDRHFASEIDTNVGALPESSAPALAAETDPLRRRDTTNLDVRRQADAEEFACAAVAALLLLCLELIVAGDLQRLVERRLVVAAVIWQHADAGVVGEIRGLYEIAPSHVSRVKPGSVSDEVTHPFDDEGGLRTSRPTIGVDHGGVRVDPFDVDVDVRDLIATGNHATVE